MAKTSEEILGFIPQPEESCPRINKAVKGISSAAKSLNYAIKYEDWKSVEEALSEIEVWAGEDEFEYCRKQCEGIRAWGQQWKELTKNLLDSYEPEWRNEKPA